jgi:hypothetical protein
MSELVRGACSLYCLSHRQLPKLKRAGLAFVPVFNGELGNNFWYKSCLEIFVQLNSLEEWTDAKDRL